jgi:hypothetical protein
MEYYKFYNTDNPEYDLYNDCSREFVLQFGIPLKFLPRKFQNKDEILGEDVLNYFDESFDFKCYLEDYSEYQGQGDIFQKFGMQVDDNMNVVCPIDYLDEILGEVPMIGDLIYMEFTDMIFEITHIEHEKAAFYMFGKTMLYRFNCRKWDYSGESVATGDADIDKIDGETNISTVDENTIAEDEAINNVLDTTEKSPFGDVY